MTGKTLMAGIGAFVAALVIVAVVFALFAGDDPANRRGAPVPDAGKDGAPAAPGKALVDVDWKSGNSDAGKTGKQPSQSKTDKTEGPSGVDNQGTD